MYHAARPSSRRNLNVALERLVGKPNLVAKHAIMANAIVAQMLPDGSIKGGSAIKMRLSDGSTRFTTDLVLPEDTNAILEGLGFRRSARFPSWRCTIKSTRSCTP